MNNYIIIGGSSGIGLGLTKSLLAQNNKVFASYNQHPIEVDDANLITFKLDVLNDNYQFPDLPDTIDGIVYCPGSIDLKPFQRISPLNMVKDYELNVVSAVKIIQAMITRLKKSKEASIVLYSTVAVQSGFNFHSQVSASKGAIEGLTRALAAELSPTIRINAIAPSLTNTPLASGLLSSEDKIKANDARHPMKRIGKIDDIVEASLFLLSNKSSWITGQIIPVDGGMSVVKG
ncbi:SDR family NAD(P)-dependent oxidoreductase [Reichenbachiella versicolor]|uniref:SDR family NAD(P)-dependent oxidoreductase n=1 Tax=Reichenbachiella versicolor TaxID=1821036 RepID=UPI000D6E4E2F|nr:SDR family oxidoreductase [Reichenbachiella versicolor]